VTYKSLSHCAGADDRPVPITSRSSTEPTPGMDQAASSAATGTTVRAAVRALRRKAPKAIILAVPVAPAETIEALRPEFDEIVCLEMPEPFDAIGQHYVDFHQVPDEEVLRLLATSHERLQPGEASTPPGKPPN
jgi:putative phosphoribosyl transferase